MSGRLSPLTRNLSAVAFECFAQVVEKNTSSSSWTLLPNISFAHCHIEPLKSMPCWRACFFVVLVSQSLLGKLLRRSPTTRLGSQSGGVADILSVPWFSVYPTGAYLAKSVAAPWLPAVQGTVDSSKYTPHKDDDIHNKKTAKIDTSQWDAEWW